MQRCLLLSLNSLNNIQKDTWLGGWLETDTRSGQHSKTGYRIKRVGLHSDTEKAFRANEGENRNIPASR